MLAKPLLRSLILIAWLLIIGLSLWLISRYAHLTTDLSAFLPRATNAQQQLLVQQLARGSESRLLLIGLTCAPQLQLAQVSEHLATSLAKNPLFTQVINGRQVNLQLLTDSQVRQQNILFRYRYLLDPAVTSQYFTVDHLHRMLEKALAQLNSNLGFITQPLLGVDPGGSWQRLLAQQVSHTKGPILIHGVWFSQASDTALLLAQTRSSGFAINAQKQALTAIHQALQSDTTASKVTLMISGPGVFAVSAQQVTQQETLWLSTIASLLLILLLLVVFRALRPVVLAVLPLASGVIVATAVVVLWFPNLYGITFAFGITLLGVAVDYPLHLFTHCSTKQPGQSAIKKLWPTLGLGLLTSCLGFAPMLFAGFSGLAQLALFAMVGLLTAALTTVWVLPVLLGCWHWRQFRLIPSAQYQLPGGLLWVSGIALLSVAYLLLTQQPLWQQDVSQLSPLPSAQLALDKRLRADLATPQVDNLVIVKGDTEQQILERLTELKPLLVKLKTTGQLAGYDLATDLLPSDLQQRARQNAIPTKAQLTQLMQQASQGLPFKAHLFEPFINDLVATKSLPLLNVQSYQHTAWGIKLDNLISHRDDHWLAVVPLTGVTQQVTQVFANYHQPDVYYLNLKVATNELLTAYRHKALVLFSLGALVIGLLMLILLHNVTVWLRVVIPPFASVATTLAILVVSQQPLTLFHLIALLLVVGLGLDYSLFFNRQGDSAAGRRRTFAAIILCGLSTLVVFGLLSFSTLPVLKAIGNTVAIGVVLNVIFAWLSRSTNTCHNRS